MFFFVFQAGNGLDFSSVTEKSFSVIILQAAARKYTYNILYVAVKDITH